MEPTRQLIRKNVPELVKYKGKSPTEDEDPGE